MIRPREIARGVEAFAVRTPTLPPATATNSYALGEREVLLVEPSTPYDDERRAWLEWARALSSHGRRIVGIVATHHHLDHASSAGYFARALAVPLFAHPATIERVADLDDVRIDPVDDGRAFDLAGARPARWIALHTPGHAPGHICLWNAEDRALVAGDMVANGSTILVPPDDDGDMADYLVQLRRLRALAPALALPAHGDPIDEPIALLDFYVAHRLEREAKVLDAHRTLSSALGRAPTIDELVARAYDDTAMILWPIAARSLRAHLEKLRREGHVA